MLSRLVRRVHMYLALFLAPWVVMYALSTLAMNHRGFFQPAQSSDEERFQQDKQQIVPLEIAGEIASADASRAVLDSLGLAGAFSARWQNGLLVIHRNDPLAPRRIRFDPKTRLATVEREALTAPMFLERLHRRRGFQHDYTLEDTWAFSVDLFIAAMLFWAGSGLWMWWEMRTTRRLGLVLAFSTTALFAILLIVL